MQQLKIWGKWKSNATAAHYMAKSQVTKLANASFVNVKQHQTNSTLLLNEADAASLDKITTTTSVPSIITTTTNKKNRRKRRLSDIEEDDEQIDVEPNVKK